MNTLTVFILYDDSLFAHGLGGLINQEGSVKIVGIATKDENAFGQIGMLKPDVTLVEAEKDGDNPGNLLTRLLAERGEAKIVTVNLSDNEAILYTGRRFRANDVQDLIKVIREPATS